VGVLGDWGWDRGVFSIVLGAVSGSVGWIYAQLNHSELFDNSLQWGLNNSSLKNTNFFPPLTRKFPLFVRCAGVDNTDCLKPKCFCLVSWN